MLRKRSTILIIDSDLGFVFWLGQSLDAAGYESIPAKNVPGAKVLLGELRVIVDLLIIRPSIAGANAFIEGLRISQDCLKTIGLLGNDEALSEFGPRMDAWQHIPLVNDEDAKTDCLELIHCVLAEPVAMPLLTRAAG
jgi:hypothetical protein